MRTATQIVHCPRFQAKSSGWVCVCLCLCAHTHLLSPLFALLSAVVRGKEALLASITPLPPVRGLWNQSHVLKYVSKGQSSVIVPSFYFFFWPGSSSSPYPALQVGILSQNSQLLGWHWRPATQRHGSSATGFSSLSINPFTGGQSREQFSAEVGPNPRHEWGFAFHLQDFLLTFGVNLVWCQSISSKAFMLLFSCRVESGWTNWPGSQNICWRQRVFSVQPGWYSPRVHLTHLVCWESVQSENTRKPNRRVKKKGGGLDVISQITATTKIRKRKEEIHQIHQSSFPLLKELLVCNSRVSMCVVMKTRVVLRHF